MTIHEKTIVRHSISFSQEDLELIRSVAFSIYEHMDIRRIICYHDRGLRDVLTAIDKVSDSVSYRCDLTVDDLKVVETLIDILCAFESRHPDDPRTELVSPLWTSLLSIKKDFYSEM